MDVLKDAGDNKIVLEVLFDYVVCKFKYKYKNKGFMSPKPSITF